MLLQGKLFCYHFVPCGFSNKVTIIIMCIVKIFKHNKNKISSFRKGISINVTLDHKLYNQPLIHALSGTSKS